MNNLPRWVAFAAVPVALLLKMTATQAFTDTNADMKEAAAERAAIPVMATAAPAAVPAVWVPLSVKSLDGMQPVFPQERLAAARARHTLVVQVGAAASSARH